MKQGPLTDIELRQAVYRWVISRGEIPTSNQIAHAAGISKQEVLDSFARLAEAHVLVLQKDGEILMAMPFSAVPTPFLITARGRSHYYANCAWDALGVPIMLRSDGKISSACGCCGTAIHISVRGNALQSDEAIVHFAIPAKHWWDNVVYTSKTMLLFQSEEHVQNWCKQWNLPLGATLTLDQIWQLATAWYKPDRRNPDWKRYSVEEAQDIFTKIGLTSPFWNLSA